MLKEKLEKNEVGDNSNDQTVCVCVCTHRHHRMTSCDPKKGERLNNAATSAAAHRNPSNERERERERERVTEKPQAIAKQTKQ